MSRCVGGWRLDITIGAAGAAEATARHAAERHVKLHASYSSRTR